MEKRLRGLCQLLPVAAGLLAAGCAPAEPPPLRISVVGDVLLDRGVPAAARRDSARLQRTARRLWEASRYVIGNLECPLASAAVPVRKQFSFRGQPQAARWLRRLGFTQLSLANNHTLDQQLAGLRTTHEVLRQAGLVGLGFAADSLAGCLPTLLGPDSSVAVFAYSALHVSARGQGCLCGRDFTILCERVAAYKTLFPRRAVIVYLHWGTEYSFEPGPEQRQQARMLIDCGAAAVVGAHPHVVQAAEFYRGRPILYSLGNFLFDQQGRGADLAAQADFDVRAGRVVATWIRPLRLRGAVPQPADETARAMLAARLQGASSALRLVPDPAGTGWQLLPSVAAAADTTAACTARQLVLPAAGATVRLRYRPRVREYQVQTTIGPTTTVLDLGFPLYRFTQGDVDNDGQPDLLVGPVKATRFDSTVRRRLFVYQLRQGRWVPRWLGSRVVYRLLYFRPARAPDTRTVVLTLEQAPDGQYWVGRYYWQGFGLVLDRFVYHSRSLDAAYLQFV
ncbi:CapA family protein [Hymenobacter chitinivorans]|uniref:Poly-gamma-glutamate capsule biosynthesis protein CapA/YwtB (Metallophosphatase superfamily) n=1 Tax=Hymenobacter chitinivorans DSM 11115 TaxID=1121954 RepID=A0A2M9BLV6_9BACT|nr:CapA family protein [Hymenobacter chitinivorans]PJJ58912.1 poly-gamma-glutamate capsule biosynthesis protein CapA/YwtB (metallophosphatase superfamily) [Hymenobacter chitinivorans DSM 11115]